MCGINGFVKLGTNENTGIEILKIMNKLIHHRGPDDDGFYTDNTPAYSLGMAMRRLSIIDLSSGNQPIYNDNESIVIVFNGEIYNYLILKSGLEEEGVKFKTASDTEVILRLYEKYGIASFGMLDGMFAFSIYDKKQDKIFIARDFFGEKPLYYTKEENHFLWASELKSITAVLPTKPKISISALNLFFQLTYIPAPFTIYEEIHKLEANHYLVFDCKRFLCEINVIEQTSLAQYNVDNKKEAIRITHDLLTQSVASRSVADVPLGTFLSGGVDSSIVSLCLAKNTSTKIDTFSIGFEKKSFDETDKSRVVAKLLNSNHHEFIIGQKDFSENLSEIILNFDEPFADSSALATYVVANKTKKYVKVALTGDGGDEVFGGYNKYYVGRLNRNYTKIISKRTHDFISTSFKSLLNTKDDNRGLRFKTNRLLNTINYEGDFYYNILSLGFSKSELGSLFKNESFNCEGINYYKTKKGQNNNTLTDYREIDKILSLEGDMLVKVDRTSMLTSLECRAPFLNKEIWNFTNQLPEEYLINGFDKKHILKEAFEKYFPHKFLNKTKRGFEVPVGDWLRGSLKNELNSFIQKEFIEHQDIFNYDYVSKLVINHLTRKVDNTFRVWTFYCFQKWYNEIYRGKTAAY